MMEALKPSVVNDHVSSSPVSVRIRSTREEDIEQIASLLASAGSDNSNNGMFNWGASIAHMRRVASFQSLLLLRCQTIREGNKAFSKVTKDCQDVQVSDSDRLRLIWEHDGFRTKLQKAATMSAEPHLWKEHNFYVCPQDTCQLQHILLTAEDVSSGTVVGFCEVAMMSAPHGEDSRAPTIANLATSSQYRRRGIAGDLLASATRYVKQHWDLSHEIALYVSNDNDAAVSLYSKHGFERHGAMDDDKLYMTMQNRVPELRS